MYAETKEASWSLPDNLEPSIRKGSLPRFTDLGARGRGGPSWLERSVHSKGPGINWKFCTQGSGTKCPSIGSLNDASYRLLQTPPSNTDLLAKIHKVEQRHRPSPDQEAFVAIGELFRGKIASPKVAAALYRAAALILGVTLARNATDANGRHGVTVAQTADGSGPS